MENLSFLSYLFPDVTFINENKISISFKVLPLLGLGMLCRPRQDSYQCVFVLNVYIRLFWYPQHNERHRRKKTSLFSMH